MSARFWKVTRWARALRFWLLLLVGLAVWAGFGTGEAHAQAQGYVCTASPEQNTCTREQAYQECKHRGETFIAQSPQFRLEWRCDISGKSYISRFRHPTTWLTTDPPNVFRWSGEDCPSGATWSENIKACSRCGSASSVTQNTFTPPNGTLRCESTGGPPPEYCVWSYRNNDDGTNTRTVVPGDAACKPQDFADQCADIPGMYWNGRIGVAGGCVPVDPPECEPGQTLGPDNVCQTATCPSGMIYNSLGICVSDNKACPAGEVRSPDGSCISNNECPAGQVRGADGTCKPDADGDEQPDDPGDDRTFAGGDSCNVPPTCSGDPILCGQARIQWRIECNLRRDYTLSGGTCDAVPVCVGRGCNAMEYAQLIQQWKIACALEESGTVVGDGADANGNGIPDVLEGPVADVVVEQGVVGTVGDQVWSQVNTSGWLGGGSCPGLPDVIGPELSAEACKQGGYIQWLMRLLAVVFAGAIIGRAAAGA